MSTSKDGDRFLHKCEICDRAEELSSAQACEEGWDYPPRIGTFGIVSPRTCGSCPITSTAWWSIAVENLAPSELSARQRATLIRITEEVDPRLH